MLVKLTKPISGAAARGAERSFRFDKCIGGRAGALLGDVEK